MRQSTHVKLLAIATAIVGTAAVSHPTWAKAPRREPTAAAHRRAQRAPVPRGGTETWDITVTHADEHMLEGHVTRSGTGSLNGGRLYGTIAGRRVNGTVTDANGGLAATFTGTLTRSGGIRGSYHDRSGATGRWDWDGPLVR